MNDAAILSDALLVFQVGEHAFCGWFLSEIMIRFLALKAPRANCFRDRWFIFDATLAILMVLETWIMLAVFSTTSLGTSNAVGSTAILRLVRFARFLRMARIAKLISSIFELSVLLKGLRVASSSVFYTLVLIAIIIYVFSVGYISLLKGSGLEEEYFSTLPYSMWNLCLVGILPDQSDLANALLQEEGGGLFAALCFIVFCIVTGLTLMNMLVAVCCQVVTIVSDVEMERLEVEYASRLVEDVYLGIMDQDHDRRLSKAEFNQVLGNETIEHVFTEIGVELDDVLAYRDIIYDEAAKLTPKDNFDGRLLFKHFMQAVLKLRGNNKATVRDIISLRRLLVQHA